MYIKGPGRGNSNSNGPEVRTHLEFAKNLMIPSQEEEEKATGFDDDQVAGLLERSGCKSFCSGLKGTEVPLGKLLRAVLIQTACQLRQQQSYPPGCREVPHWLCSCLALNIPITQGLRLLSLRVVLIVSLRAQ